MVALVLDYPVLSAIFREQKAEKHLMRFQVDSQYCRNSQRDPLLASARRALICVKSVELNQLVCTTDWGARELACHKVVGYIA